MPVLLLQLLPRFRAPRLLPSLLVQQGRMNALCAPHCTLCCVAQVGRLAACFPLYMFTPWLEDSLKAANPDTLKVCVRTAGGGRQCRPWSGCPVRTGCTPAFKGHASTLSDLRCCSTATWTSGVSC